MTRNQIELRSVKEQERHNLATEQLEAERNKFTNEHYIRSDAAAMSQAGAAWANVEVNRINALTNRMAVEETVRYHNLSVGLEQQRLGLQEQQLALQTWRNQADVKIASQEIGYKAASLEFQQEKWAQEYGLEQYKANLSGLQFKENIRQYEGNLEYKYYDTDKSYKARQTGNVLNFIGNVIGTAGKLTGSLIKFEGGH